jgi:prepilin-type N-terminal cleavage/methylation domain-containing protein
MKINRCTLVRSLKTRGMTLVEIMIATGIGSLVLLASNMTFLNSSVSFAALGNYITMDSASRNAIDRMTRDIRKAKDLISYSTNQLVFKYAGTTNLIYSFDSNSGYLTEWKTGDSKTNNLLSGCSNLQFSMYQNTPQPGGTLNTTLSPSQGKAISVAWKCSRRVFGRRVATEDMQQALIVIRNKPVL